MDLFTKLPIQQPEKFILDKQQELLTNDDSNILEMHFKTTI